MAGALRRVFADHAWLGREGFVDRVLVEFDCQIRSVTRLRPEEKPSEDVIRVGFLMPGLINAHCHLEYSWLKGKLPSGEIPFGRWMQAIMAERPQSDEDYQVRFEAMGAGAQALLAGGCTTVFDSTTDGASAEILCEAGLRAFLFYEVLGLSQERAEPIWERVLEAVLMEGWRRSGWEKADGPGRVLGHGLNPHAPYSVGPWLREQLRKAPEDMVQAWHLAETPDEEEMFRRGEGSIAEFLREAGLPAPGEGAESSFEFLRTAGMLDRCKVIFHGNELTPDAAKWFRASRAVVHCPATHRWFERRQVPLRRWLDDGVNVCLGTDSLASSETLSMLEIVRYTLEDHLDVSVDEVLTMACVNPYKAELPGTGAHNGGQIKAAAPADLVAVDGGEILQKRDDGPERYRDMLSSGNVASRVWIDGVQVV